MQKTLGTIVNVSSALPYKNVIAPPDLLRPPGTLPVTLVDASGLRVFSTPSPGRCMAYGQGLAGGAVGRTLTFIVTTVSEDGNLINTGGASVVGVCTPLDPGARAPSKCSTSDNGDGTYTCMYSCTVPGGYDLGVRVEGQHIAGSPFRVKLISGGIKIHSFRV
jgi:hypothetical protein